MRAGRSALTLAATGLLALTGCGGEKRLAFVSVQPPAGSTAEGVTADPVGRPGGSSGEPIFRFETSEGADVAYSVTVRNVSRERVEVLDATFDPERDNGFVVQSVAGAPLAIEPGDQATVEVRGRIAACVYDGQVLDIADPELVLRLPDGETDEEFVVTETKIEYVAPKREDC